MFYENFRSACARRGTTLTAVLRALHRSTGSTGRWSSGSYPTLDIVMELANYLNMSIDDLVYGENGQESAVDDDRHEWIYIISRIPEDRQQMCKDFLKTPMTVHEKYADRKKA